MFDHYVKRGVIVRTFCFRLRHDANQVQLSSREWAGLFWLVVAAIACLCLSGVRRSVAQVMRLAFGRKLLSVWLLYLIWIAGFNWISNLLGYWENALGKLTLVWTLTAGVVLVSKFSETSKSGLYRAIIGRLVGITVLIEYIIALAFGIRLKWIHEAEKGGTVHLARSKSVRQAYRAGREFVRQKLSEIRRENEYQEILIRFAGSEDVDGGGRPLDKREFRETVRALNWLYTCQSLWYSREPQGYEADLLERLGDNFSRAGRGVWRGSTLR